MIGILAGMGPMSTAPFIDLLMKEWQISFQAKNDIDFPHVLTYSLPTPFYLDRPVDHQLMASIIKEGLLKLQSWGAKFIAMPCNTAHQYFNSFEKALDIKLLNIIQETVDNISESIQKVAVLATQSTMESELYQKSLLDKKKEIIFKPEWQQLVDQLITHVKANKSVEIINPMMKKLMEEFIQSSVEAIIIGCTDLTLLFENHQTDHIKIIDSSKALVQAIIRENNP
ncbi:amino acid racemase [Thiotrichales bacterium 19S11-10]|nr:amino acid racemase [Thiotrichales bacterium 19S11-10]